MKPINTEELRNNTKHANVMNRYFYIDSEGVQKGTFTLDDLRNEPVRRDTMVWTQGMPEWQRAYDVVELQPLFDMSTNAQKQFSETTPPPQVAAQSIPAMPKSWMVESILVTILPFVLCGNVLSLIGIAAIVNASKVESLFNSGLYAQSIEASNNAARWTKITLWIAIGAILLAIIAIIAFVVFFGSLAGIGEAFM